MVVVVVVEERGDWRLLLVSVPATYTGSRQLVLIQMKRTLTKVLSRSRSWFSHLIVAADQGVRCHVMDMKLSSGYTVPNCTPWFYIVNVYPYLYVSSCLNYGPTVWFSGAIASYMTKYANFRVTIFNLEKIFKVQNFRLRKSLLSTYADVGWCIS